MKTPKRRFFSGSSLEAALVMAASEYGVAVEEVAYKLVEKRHGFLRVRRNVVIEVDPTAPKKEPEPAEKPRPVAGPPPSVGARERRTAEVDEGSKGRGAARSEEARWPQQESAGESDGDPSSGRAVTEEHRADDGEEAPPAPPRARGRSRTERADHGAEGDRKDQRPGTRERERPPRGPVKQGPLSPIEKRLRPARGAAAEAIGEALDWVLDLVDLDVDAQVFQGEDRYEVELRGPDREQLIRDEGKLLAAIEHLVPRVLHGVCGETYAIRVDSENFQEGREDRLRETAQKVAEEVRRRGRAEVLEPMDPAARRVIHLALAEEPDVSTKSLGTGLYKRVKVFPS